MVIRVCTALLLVAFAFSSWAGDREPMPEVYYAEEWSTDHPYFVAASRAITEGGEIDEALLRRSSLKHHLTWPEEGGCVRVLTDAIGNEPAEYRANFRKALTTSDWVFVGEVTDLQPGFSGTGGTLVRVEVQENLKGDPSNYRAHYLFLPTGEFTVAGIRLCYINDRYPQLPQVGDRLLLFVDRTKNDGYSRNHGEFLWTGNDTGLVLLGQDGKVGLPDRLRDEGLPTDPQRLLLTAESLLREEAPREVQR